MSYKDNEYITAKDLSFIGVLDDIKKSQKSLQPIFEGLTNAFEAIKIKARTVADFKGSISIKIYSNETIDSSSVEFRSLTITDNGIGFNDEEFNRFNTFKLTTKGFKNLGSGRIQFVHYFDSTTVSSVFEKDGKFYEREFVVSKKKPFIDKNAIVLHTHCKEKEGVQETGTVISFNSLLEHSNIYNNLNQDTFKQAVLTRYIHYLCHNRLQLPEIKIEFFVQSSLAGESQITSDDILQIDKSETVEIGYYQIANGGKALTTTGKSESFTIDAFKIPSDISTANRLNLVSKGEVVEESGVTLENLAGGDQINGNQYVFLVSGKYIDERDTNVRGTLNIPRREDSSRTLSLFTGEEIFLEDIQEAVNDTISKMYPEIEQVKKDHEKDIAKLKEMFLLDEETANSINISVNDSESKILTKFYEAEAKKSAEVDAKIKESIDKLNNLDTTSANYQTKLAEEVEALVKVIPQQNKNSLTHYVARRKLVLELFDKILESELAVQTSGGRDFNEKLIHNLLFQQRSSDPENSDLWIINEDFIYFKGSSEEQLSKVKIGEEKLFKASFEEEEKKYLSSLGEKRLTKRPDVLLFPEEGKCIILEFKAPDVNASDHLLQIDFYASLIRNHTEDKFQITTFYGYLIGENIEPRDVIGRVSRYELSYHLDYLFRPSETVVGFDGRSNGSIYNEVIKYSTLLERARKRNEIFINKLNKSS